MANDKTWRLLFITLYCSIIADDSADGELKLRPLQGIGNSGRFNDTVNPGDTRGGAQM